MTQSFNFDYSGGSTNNDGNNSSSKNNLSSKTAYRIPNTYFSPRKKSVKIKYGSSLPEVLFKKGVLKICIKFPEEHQCRFVISVKLQCNFY